MPDMYDNLGEMLNEALESGKIPKNKKEPDDTVVECSQGERIETTAKSGSFILDKGGFDTTDDLASHYSNHRIFKKKDQISTGEVIKLHKYTYNMQFPPHIQKALGTLDIVYPVTQKDIVKQYHKLLKENHPDTKKTIQTSKNVENCRQKTIDDITEAYKILCTFFGIK